MAVRKFFRGTIEWDRIETVFRELAERYDEPVVRVTFLNADNWLSTPCVVNDRWFVKIVSRQNSLVHSLFTGARNLGAFSSGTEGFFEHISTPLEMAQHELEATQRMRELGINAPEPVEAFEVDDLGVLVMEYLPNFRTLDDLDPETVGRFAGGLFASLATMHAHGIVHGDLRAENVLVHADGETTGVPPVPGPDDGELYFIDATNVRDDGHEGARAYDLASALAVLEPMIGARRTVDAALEHYSAEDLLAAREFLDFVKIRPDHDFDAAAVKGEVEKRAASGAPD